MSKQTISDKDEELQAVREALDSAKEEAERERCELQRAIENLEMQN